MSIRRRPCSLAGTVLCGLLFLAVMIVWVRGWLVSDFITGFDRISANGEVVQWVWNIESWNGSIRIRRSFTVSDGRFSYIPFVDGHSHGWQWKTTPVVGPSFSAGLGSWRYDSQIRKNNDDRRVQVPYWMIESVVLVPGILFYLRFRGRRKYPEGFCAGCGYDIRATPQRCPECGTASRLAGVV